jgi:cysteine desulfurase
MRYVYLDNNATTQVDETVFASMVPFFRERFGNPSSPHSMGKEAFVACSDARDNVAYLLRCSPSEIVFTSGATESNNLLLLGFSRQSIQKRRIVTSKIEHKSVRMPCRLLQTLNFDVQEICVTPDGVVDLFEAAQLIDQNTALVSVQAANNETGVLQPINELADMAHSKGALVHCDAAQWIGKLPVPDWFAYCDFISISGHKFYGPKGVGVLMIRNGFARRSVAPVILGGGQENGFRSGTSNVPSIVGIGVACGIVNDRVAKDMHDIEIMRNIFEKAIISEVPWVQINGANVPRLPGTCSLTIPGIPAQMVIANLDRICVGEGSACTSGSSEPSHVLVAMGLSREEADSTIRISFGRTNSPQDAVDAAQSVANVARYLRDKVGS